MPTFALFPPVHVTYMFDGMQVIVYVSPVTGEATCSVGDVFPVAMYSSIGYVLRIVPGHTGTSLGSVLTRGWFIW